MEIKFILQRVSDPPKLAHFQQPYLNLAANGSLIFALIEKGMVSGDPSVMIISENPEGTVFLQTSLDKLITATNLAVTNAKEHLGWEQPEGYVSLLPMDKAARKAILEQIKKELEEWDDIDKELDNG